MFWFKHNTASIADGAIRIQPQLDFCVVDLLKRSLSWQSLFSLQDLLRRSTASFLVFTLSLLLRHRAESAQLVN